MFPVLILALATAVSGGPVKPRQGQSQVEITFIGAANAQFTQSFPTDGSIIQISRPIQMHTGLKLPSDEMAN